MSQLGAQEAEEEETGAVTVGPSSPLLLPPAPSPAARPEQAASAGDSPNPAPHGSGCKSV